MIDEFLETVREDMRLRGYSMSIEKTYILWIKRFIYFAENQVPQEIETSRITEYLTYLVTGQHVRVNTQKRP